MPAYEKKSSLPKRRNGPAKSRKAPKSRVAPKKRVAPATPQSRANKIKNEKLRNDVPMGARTFASSQNGSGLAKVNPQPRRKTKRG